MDSRGKRVKEKGQAPVGFFEIEIRMWGFSVFEVRILKKPLFFPFFLGCGGVGC